MLSFTNNDDTTVDEVPPPPVLILLLRNENANIVDDFWFEKPKHDFTNTMAVAQRYSSDDTSVLIVVYQHRSNVCLM